MMSACIAGILERNSVSIVGNEILRHFARENVAAEVRTREAGLAAGTSGRLRVDKSAANEKAVMM
jgi:hypothetical protein